MFILQTHYRNPIDFAPDSLQASKIAFQRLVRAVECLGNRDSKNQDLFSQPLLESGQPPSPLLYHNFHNQFCEAMDNDFNTAKAIACLFLLADVIVTKITDSQEKRKAAKVLFYYANLLGLQLTDSRQAMAPETANKLMSLLLQLRAQAKEEKTMRRPT